MEKKVLDKKELIQQFRTEGILDAARSVISRKGLEKATMEQVADEAGISKATIYLYFKNKEELYYRCVVDRMDWLISEMEKTAAETPDPMERLRGLVFTNMKCIELDRDFFKVFLTESKVMLFDKSSEFGHEFARRHERLAGILSGCIKECMEKKLLREMDPLKCHNLLFSMIRGTAIYCIMRATDNAISEEAPVILDVFLNGMTA